MVSVSEDAGSDSEDHNSDPSSDNEMVLGDTECDLPPSTIIH